MSTQRKIQISCLNDASEKIVKSHECLEQEVEKLSTDDQNIKEIKNKVASVLEACANQQQVSREVYMEQNKETGKKISEYFLLQLEEYTNAQFAKKNLGLTKNGKHMY